MYHSSQGYSHIVQSEDIESSLSDIHDREIHHNHTVLHITSTIVLCQRSACSINIRTRTREKKRKSKIVNKQAKEQASEKKNMASTISYSAIEECSCILGKVPQTCTDCSFAQ